jgi:hypothetical protein
MSKSLGITQIDWSVPPTGRILMTMWLANLSVRAAALLSWWNISANRIPSGYAVTRAEPVACVGGVLRRRPVRAVADLLRWKRQGLLCLKLPTTGLRGSQGSGLPFTLIDAGARGMHLTQCGANLIMSEFRRSCGLRPILWGQSALQ